MAKAVQIASVFTAIGFKVDKKDLNRLQKQLGNLKKQIRGLANVNVKMDLFKESELRHAKSELQQIKKLVNEIPKKVNVAVTSSGLGAGTGAREARSASGRGAFVGGALGSQFGQFAPGVGGIGAAFFGGASILKTGQRLEAIRAGLTAAAGSAEGGAEAFQFMVDLSERLGINFEDNVRSFQNFLASGNAVNFSQDESRKVFTATASAARVLGLSAADTNGVMRAMTQILSKGTVQAEELRGQLGERLPGAVGLMSKALGVSVEELNKMLENGEVISKDALPKLRVEVLKFAEANGALDKAVNSNLANQERLANAWFFFKANIAESGFMDTMTQVFVDLASSLRNNKELATTVGQIFTWLARVVKAVASVVQDLFTLFAVLPTHWKIIVGLLAISLFHFSRLATVVVTVVAVLEDLFNFLKGEESVFGTFIENASTATKWALGLASALTAVAIAVKVLRGLKVGITLGALGGLGARGAAGAAATAGASAAAGVATSSAIRATMINGVRTFVGVLFKGLTRAVMGLGPVGLAIGAGSLAAPALVDNFNELRTGISERLAKDVDRTSESLGRRTGQKLDIRVSQDPGLQTTISHTDPDG